MILLLDNRRMAAISGLQEAQYGHAFRTNDSVRVDYLRLGSVIPGVQCLDGGNAPDSLRKALMEASKYERLSLVHVPVYYGPDPLGGLGAYGVWNVGNWCQHVQDLYHSVIDVRHSVGVLPEDSHPVRRTQRAPWPLWPRWRWHGR